MCLFVDVLLNLVDGLCHRTIAALLGQAFQASQHTMYKHGLLFLNGLDVLVLLLLFQKPFVCGKNRTKDNA